MSLVEMQDLLLRVGFGHLGCTRDNHPYIVPRHYAYDSQNLYFFTTEGTKTEYMAANHEVCFQVEEITDASNWRSVMVIGRAEKVAQKEEVEHVMQLLTKYHPSLMPALNVTEIGAWKRLSNTALYRVRPIAIYGRKTV
jgi:nitroimidazol reductase NimA-like FMN-containing flavoprotein (pyridoxamine 5'-phosphate oxidase superfamily)